MKGCSRPWHRIRAANWTRDCAEALCCLKSDGLWHVRFGGLQVGLQSGSGILCGFRAGIYFVLGLCLLLNDMNDKRILFHSCVNRSIIVIFTSICLQMLSEFCGSCVRYDRACHVYWKELQTLEICSPRHLEGRGQECSMKALTRL